MLEKNIENNSDVSWEYEGQDPNDVLSSWEKIEKRIEINGDVHKNGDVQPLWRNLEKEVTAGNPRLPEKDGHWEGEKGNSRWVPDPEAKPGDRHGTNVEGKTWNEISKENDVKSIPFNDGEPDFSEVAKEEVKIDDFSDNRAANFDQADEALAKKLGCEPEDVAQWRKDHKYTWHEKSDCKTMQLVPTEVHGNVPHSGGVSKYKAEKAEVKNQKGA